VVLAPVFAVLGAVLGATPKLVVIVLIAAGTRYLLKLARYTFSNIKQGSLGVRIVISFVIIPRRVVDLVKDGRPLLALLCGSRAPAPRRFPIGHLCTNSRSVASFSDERGRLLDMQLSNLPR